MRFRDTGMGFGAITIGMHWVGAALVLGFTIVGIGTMLTPAGQNSAAMISLGLATSGVSLFRLVWRSLHHYPLPLGAKPPLILIAQRSMVLALLLGGVVLPWLFFSLLSEEQDSGVAGHPPDLFAFLPHWSVAALFWVGSTLVLLTALVHAGAAIAGALGGRDPSLARMMGWQIEP